MADIEKLAREMVNNIVGKSEVRWVDEKALAKHYLALLDENTALRELVKRYSNRDSSDLKETDPSDTSCECELCDEAGHLLRKTK